jgi:hypothetical protein
MADAGLNRFTNVHSPLNYVGGGRDRDRNFVTTVFDPHVVTSHPTWGPGVETVPTRLLLNGVVNVQLPGSSVNVLFIGMLGGAPLTIAETYTRSQVINERMFGDQAISGTAVSTLRVTIVGGASLFLPGSGDFIGVVPEPNAVALLGTGLFCIALLWARARRSRVTGFKA